MNFDFEVSRADRIMLREYYDRHLEILPCSVKYVVTAAFNG